MHDTMSPQVQKLRLAPHVRACSTEGQVILLNLNTNKYLGVGGKNLPALASAVDGWPACPSTELTRGNPGDIGAMTLPLLSQGLLTYQDFEQPRNGIIEEATLSIDAYEAMRGVALGPRRLFCFLHSAALATAWLRSRSLRWIAEEVLARRYRLKRTSNLDSHDALRDALAAYEKLRPLVFTARDKCLFDSLALINFFASEGLFPTWVIGVKAAPFGAHSWLQSGAVVLNDLHDHVRKFRPILIV